jgi:nitrite reductase/ring-hydroxylating ferredoxin subunit
MEQPLLKYGKYLVFFLLLSMAAPSCDKIYDSPIPDVYVSFTVNLANINELTVSGNSVFFPRVGYGGVIIYCQEPGAVYYAFDATCTYEARNNCVVLKNEELDHCPCLLDSPIVTCTCCESEFVTIDGSPIKGPATMSLKQYNVSVINNTTLRVYN